MYLLIIINYSHSVPSFCPFNVMPVWQQTVIIRPGPFTQQRGCTHLSQCNQDGKMIAEFLIQQFRWRIKRWIPAMEQPPGVSPLCTKKPTEASRRGLPSPRTGRTRASAAPPAPRPCSVPASGPERPHDRLDSLIHSTGLK